MPQLEVICEKCGEVFPRSEVADVKIDLAVVVYRRALCGDCASALYHPIREFMGTPLAKKCNDTEAEEGGRDA